MHKCYKCGKEFEGKFCPDCGAEWYEEKICPKCGAKLDGASRFCNECGYSFVKQEGGKTKNKSNKFFTWIKTHLKIVLPVSISLVILIVLLSLIPTFIALKTNGTYYKLNYNGEIDKKTYFILDSGKWSDDDGETGTYKKEGDNVVFYYTFFGETEELCSGTVSDGVLKVKNGGSEDTYISESHKHKYGEWEIKREATCLNDGLQSRSCACGIKETQAIKAVGYHTGDWVTTKETSCSEEGSKTLHCTVCGEDEIKSIEKLPHTGKWVTIKEASCSEEGQQEFICTVCNDKSTKAINKLPHALSDWIFDNYSHYKNCNVCGAKVDYAAHDGEKYCNSCKYPLQDSVGLELNLNSSNDGYIVTGIGTSTDTIIRIPERFNNLPIVSIADNAFEKCSSIKYVIIPDSVTSIGASAFRECSALKNVVMSQNVTSIGSYAFYACTSLLEITFPENVTSIGDYAFYGCFDLVKINFNAKSCSDLRAGNFVFFKAGMDGSGITVAFGPLVEKVPSCLLCPYSNGGTNVNLKNVVFAENSVCDNIEYGAFLDSGTVLKNIVLPKSVNTIDYYAFRGPAKGRLKANIFYMGTADDWENINIAPNNEILFEGIMYYYSLSNPYTSNPNDENLYWHYVNGEIVIWTKEN